jgi:GPH family glycoside/pentoside/hexuronide:cation symporter
VYALYSFARKLGQALAAGLSGWLLTGIGYDSNAAQAGLGQSNAVLNGIFNISTIVPAIGFVSLALVLWFWYPLHKKKVDQNVELLKQKHAEQAPVEVMKEGVNAPATPVDERDDTEE